MQLNTERCPKCGKYKSMTWWNPAANAAATAVPATLYTQAAANATATSAGPFHIDGVLWNAGAAVAQPTTFTYSLCTCAG